jgi:putative hydroxymethylpyrimidine transport system ATP-binding protein
VNAGPKLAARGVSVTKGSVRILDGMDLVVEPGTFVALIGPSGAGKSTLLGLLAGLETPDGGVVEKDGAPLVRPDLVAYMPQSDLLLPWRSVVANVSLGLEATGAPKRAARATQGPRRHPLLLLPYYRRDGGRAAGDRPRPRPPHALLWGD